MTTWGTCDAHPSRPHQDCGPLAGLRHAGPRSEPQAQRAIFDGYRLLVIDEIGRMERPGAIMDESHPDRPGGLAWWR
jgi:hypothetical protein